MKNFYKAEYKGQVSLRSTANAYTTATFYDSSETTFHSRADLAGKATQWTGAVVAVVPAVQITAAEYKEIQKAKKAAGALVIAERQSEFAANNPEVMFFLDLADDAVIPSGLYCTTMALRYKKDFATFGYLGKGQIADLLAHLESTKAGS
jgi:hypothetical protein